MKMHKLEVYVIDFEKRGSKEYVSEIENIDGVSRVKLVQTVGIGEFEDDHILNQNSTSIEEFRKYFSK